jgi:hypothetical protein
MRQLALKKKDHVSLADSNAGYRRHRVESIKRTVARKTTTIRS